jgi:hypothetical protein
MTTVLRSKDLLGTQELSAAEIALILDTAESMRPIGEQDIKKVPALRGLVVGLFFEPRPHTSSPSSRGGSFPPTPCSPRGLRREGSLWTPRGTCRRCLPTSS